jgi:phenylalanine-4-hydroxylase
MVHDVGVYGVAILSYSQPNWNDFMQHYGEHMVSRADNSYVARCYLDAVCFVK